MASSSGDENSTAKTEVVTAAEVAELRARLTTHKQQHLLQFAEELSPAQLRTLVHDLRQLDVAEVNEFYARVAPSLTQSAAQSSSSSSTEEEGSFEETWMQPVPAELRGSSERSPPELVARYERTGLEAVARNEVAALLLAGGQGTRLGVAHPKGMYSVGLVSQKTLYQLQAERLIRLQRLAAAAAQSSSTEDIRITWYIMTSEHTKELTERFFAQHNYFGLERADVLIFEQFMLPCLARLDGRILLDEKWRVARAPDGNGGLYRALKKRGVLEHMRARNINYVHVYGVDNILVKVADPAFVGFCIDKGANCAAKVVRKTDPDEKVGVICKVKDRFQVVEYSEISERTRNLREADTGELTYSAGNICNHFFTREFLDLVCSKHEHELRHHVAEKKIPFVDESGAKVTPKHVNGIKLEKFVFDVFPFSTNFAIWEVNRVEEFSPLKNGLDSKNENPLTCKRDLYAQHQRWLQKAGIKILPTSKIEPKNSENSNEAELDVEISPLVSYNGEGLEKLAANHELLTSPVLVDLDPSTNQIVVKSTV